MRCQLGKYKVWKHLLVYVLICRAEEELALAKVEKVGLANLINQVQERI